MKRSSLGLTLSLLGLTASAFCAAPATPDATLKGFLAAMQKRDRKAIKSSIDWKALAKSLGMDKEKPERREQFMETMQIVYVETFAMGKEATAFKVGPVTTKGATAQGGFLRQDKATKKWVPATQFGLQKEGKNWMITSISGKK